MSDEENLKDRYPRVVANPDFSVTSVKFGGFFEHDGIKGFTLKWETVSAGFGELEIYEKLGEIVCDNEAMSPGFVKAVLTKWVDGMLMLWVACDEHGKMMCPRCPNV